jgi:hypothetical protein
MRGAGRYVGPSTPRSAPAPSQLAALLVGTLGMSVLGFSKLAEDVSTGDPIVSLDSSAAVWFHEHAGHTATAAVRAVTELGGPVLTVVAMVATALLVRARRLGQAAFVAAALVGGQILNWLLKAAFERPRPSFSAEGS